MNKPKILVTGAAGVLGTDLCYVLKSVGYDVCQSDLSSNVGIMHLDVRDISEVSSVVGEEQPGLVIHLAAETDVDRCQIEPDHAYRSNTLGTWNVALTCQKKDIPMVYVSTAGVFDGEKAEPYIEFDDPNPVNIYGKAKLEGERLVSRLLSKYFIVRAAWMIGGGAVKDKKFVGKIMKQIDAGTKKLKAVNDKVGSLTYSLDFSHCLADLIKTDFYGLYHMANKGNCTRYDVARHILDHVNRKDVSLDAVTSETFVLPAPRARSEMLRNYMLELRGMDTMRDWREALNDYLDKHFSCAGRA
ncbi:MAG: dTDP-4-dehydrorhamnose reductase [Candidatus Bathyarchaeia archaeon]